MSDTLLVAIGTLASLLVTAGVTAWITLRKSRAELDKIKAEEEKLKRNGVLEEWRVITDRLQTTVKDQDTEIKALRAEVIKLYAEMAELRIQILARETERVEQRGEIRTLEKKVVEMKKPDTEELAQAIVPKLAEALQSPSGANPSPTPVTLVQDKDAEPVRVDQQKEPKPDKS